MANIHRVIACMVVGAGMLATQLACGTATPRTDASDSDLQPVLNSSGNGSESADSAEQAGADSEANVPPPEDTPSQNESSPLSPSLPFAWLTSEIDRILEPELQDGELDDLIVGNSRFALDLYQRFRTAGGNLFYSPFSISIALAMVRAGARGETERQIGQALHFTLDGQRLDAVFNALDLELSTRGQDRDLPEETGFSLNIVNAIWGQQDHTFQASYIDHLGRYYGTGLQLLDFASDPDVARTTINDWASAETEGKIVDLLPSGSISAVTKLVLTNAIYFNAPWQYAFPPEGTHDGMFHRLDGSQVIVAMMQHVELHAHIEGDNYVAVELPYSGEAVSMLVLLPDEGVFQEVEEALDFDLIESVASNSGASYVHVTMPKFTYAWETSLSAALAGMGMPDAFSSRTADFSAIDHPDCFLSRTCLHIGGVYHKAFVLVDESGTETAAATAVVFDPTVGVSPPQFEFRVDRPFFYFIRDNPTGTILFVGRVLDPSI